MAKCLSDPASCPLGTRHPPHGIEFGMGCGLCRDDDSKAANEKASACAALLFDAAYLDHLGDAKGAATDVRPAERMTIDKARALLCVPPTRRGADAQQPWRIARSKGTCGELGFLAEFEIDASSPLVSAFIGLLPIDMRAAAAAAPAPPAHDALPPGWEMRFDKKSQRVYYADTATKTTQWVRPRLPEPAPPLAPQQGRGLHSSGVKFVDGVEAAFAEPFGAGDKIGVRFDASSRHVQFLKNGASLGTAFTLDRGAAYLCIGVKHTNAPAPIKVKLSVALL